MTTRLLQISDPHIGADWGLPGPVAGLREVVAAAGALPDPADGLLVSGDIANEGSAEQYVRCRRLLEPLGLKPLVLAGNHDARGPLRTVFRCPGSGDEPIRYAAEVGPLRLLALDSTIPGSDAGDLDAESLDWLDAELDRYPGAPTVLGMHHPPLLTGMPFWDESALSERGREGLAAVLARHPQVLRIVAGHVHRVIVGELAGRPIATAPSSYLQARLRSGASKYELVNDPPGFAIHALEPDGALVSHVQTIAPVRQ